MIFLILIESAGFLRACHICGVGVHVNKARNASFFTQMATL